MITVIISLQLLHLLGSLRGNDGCCNINITSNQSSVLRLFHVDHVVENRPNLLSKGFTAAGSRCRQKLKYENLTSSFGRLRQKVAPKSVPHVQYDYFPLFNQPNHRFVALSLPLPFLKLAIT